MRVTVDASVAVKWFVAEDHRKEARHLLGPGIERLAPDLLPVECANTIWKKARRGEIDSVTPFLEGITRLPEVVGIQPGQALLRDATETAVRIGHPVYDCLYIACAKLTGSVLAVRSDQNRILRWMLKPSRHESGSMKSSAAPARV